MIVYRISKKQFIEDLTGEGARLFGGRWNRKGINMIYTAQSRSLAILETLVHLPIALIPKDLYIAEILLPDDIETETILLSNLPENWSVYPAPNICKETGSLRAEGNQTLYLKAPSVLVKEEWNVMINPAHKRINDVKISSIKKLDFDERLLRKRLD